MHEQHIIFEPDVNFETGTLAHLVAGNKGRVLDGRRTPGFIESYDEESAMFIWRITGFEDAGKCWEIPAEQIGSYQFRRGSVLLPPEDVKCIEARCRILNQKMEIPKLQTAAAITGEEIARQMQHASAWILANSAFYHSGITLDFSASSGSELLFQDIKNYLSEAGLYELEKMTAEQYLLNPYSGEWIKGMKIVMAEMGLIAYAGTNIRRQESFSGIGDKQLRSKYIIARIAFLRSMSVMKGISEVPLFRGMSSERDFFETPDGLLSMTFSLDTAMEFADMKQLSDSRSAYVVKYTCPVEKLFMTFFETEQFNERYPEQEAVIFYDGAICF